MIKILKILKVIKKPNYSINKTKKVNIILNYYL